MADVNTPMTPAMTPEEWAAVEAAAPASGAASAWLDVLWSGPRPHAAAAALLHGQPFGFTHEDVRMLRKLIAAEENDNALVYDYERYPIRKRMPTLADRTEALLPPKP